MSTSSDFDSPLVINPVADAGRVRAQLRVFGAVVTNAEALRAHIILPAFHAWVADGLPGFSSPSWAALEVAMFTTPPSQPV